MRNLIGYIALGFMALLVVLIVLVRALLRYYRQQDAAAWKPTGYRQRFAQSGYDESKAVDAAKRARAHDERRVNLATARAGLKTTQRQPAEVIEIERRRAGR